MKSRERRDGEAGIVGMMGPPFDPKPEVEECWTCGADTSEMDKEGRAFCNDSCSDAYAEVAYEAMAERFHGGDAPVTAAERQMADYKQKQRLR